MIDRKGATAPVLALLLASCYIGNTNAFSLTNSRSSVSVGNVGVGTCPSSKAVSASASSSSPLGALRSMPFVINNAQRIISSTLLMATATEGGEYPAASDGEALQSLFAKNCDGLMAEAELTSVPAIKEMLDQGDLLSSELAEIWKAAPKFPQEDESAADKIDVDSFIQVYRDIDDLFEDDKQEGAAAAAEESKKDAVTKSEEVDVVDEELSQTFATLTTTQGGNSITFSQLRQWEEITSLIEDEGILSDDELVSLWENAVGTKGKEGSMDVIKFVSFNNELDDLFEFDGEDNEDDAEANLSDGEADEDTEEEIAQGAEEPEAAAAPAPLPIITEEDLPPGVLFSQLANENYLVGKVELQRWGELNGMLNEGDLTVDELNTLFDNAAKAPGTKDMLDEDGFCSLFEAIDNLFEDDNDDEAAPPAQAAVRELKEELLEYIEDMANLAEEEGLQICGLDSGDLEQERVLEIVSELEREPYNKVTAVTDMGGGAVDKMELVGTWDLLYSSSSTMKYNEGLSGLAGGLTRFGGLQQELSSTKYMSDVEYSEQVIGKLGGNAMEVKIKGDWDMRTEVSLFTGRPSNVMTVIPDKVVYGPRSDKADHWKSLGPMNLLVLTYLDEDIRIMRGNTSTDTLFIWSRAK